MATLSVAVLVLYAIARWLMRSTLLVVDGYYHLCDGAALCQSSWKLVSGRGTRERGNNYEALTSQENHLRMG